MSTATLKQHVFRTVEMVALIAMLSGSAAVANDVEPVLVQRLVEQLADTSRTTRVAAEQSLRDLGPDVLPHLPSPEELTSAAQRDAVLRLRTLLERQLAEKTVQASHVTLSGKLNLRDVALAIAKQTGNRVSIAGLTSQRLDRQYEIDWMRISFWEAIRELEERAEIRSRLSEEGQQLQLIAAEGTGPAALMFEKGAFRIVGHSLVCRPDFTDQQRDIVRVRFDVLAEPRLRPLFVRVEHRYFEMTTGEQVLPPLNPEAKLERPAERRGATPLSIDFITTQPCKIDNALLKGQLDIELAAGEERFVFRHLDTSEGVARRHGGVVVTLDRSSFVAGERPAQSSARVELRVAYDSTGPAFESHRTWVFHNVAFLQTHDGARQWFPVGFDTVAEAEAAVKLSYRFENVAATAAELEFVYSAPTLLQTVPIEFELRQIPSEALGVESPAG